MDLIQINKQNEKYFSEDYIKGFNTGALRQYLRDTVEIKTGEWFIDNKKAEITCNRCGESFNSALLPRMAYCPNCGAKMETNNE